MRKMKYGVISLTRDGMEWVGGGGEWGGPGGQTEQRDISRLCISHPSEVKSLPSAGLTFISVPQGVT